MSLSENRMSSTAVGKLWWLIALFVCLSIYGRAMAMAVGSVRDENAGVSADSWEADSLAVRAQHAMEVMSGSPEESPRGARIASTAEQQFITPPSRIDCPDGGPPIIFRALGDLGWWSYLTFHRVVHIEYHGDQFSWNETYPDSRGEARSYGSCAGGRFTAQYKGNINYYVGFLDFFGLAHFGSIEAFVRGPAGTPYYIRRHDQGVVMVEEPDGCGWQGPFVAAGWEGACNVGAGYLGGCFNESHPVECEVEDSRVTQGNPTYFDEYPGIEYRRVYLGNANANAWVNNGASSGKRGIGLADVASEIEAYINRGGPPVAEIQGPDVAYVGTPASFSGAGSSDPDGGPLEYRWSAEGSPTINGVDEAGCEMTWAQAGDYPVRLEVVDCDGRRAEALHPVHVTQYECDMTIAEGQPVKGQFVCRPSGFLLGISAHQPVTLNAGFTGTCACCEYRQYRMNLTTLMGFASGLAAEWGRYVEDVASTDDPCRSIGQYGHRDASPNCRWDSYTPEPRMTGDHYYAYDYPGSDGPAEKWWTYRAKFQARLNRVPRPGYGCVSSGEETKRDWEVCIKHRPVLGCTDCATPVADEETPTILGRKTITYTYVTTSRAEYALGFLFSDNGDSIGVSVAGTTKVVDGNYLGERARRISLEVEGLDAITMAVPAVLLESERGEWSRVFIYRRPAEIPSTVHVILRGLGNQIEFDQQLSPENAESKPPSGKGVATVIAGNGVTPTVYEEDGGLDIRPLNNPAHGSVRLLCRVGKGRGGSVCIFDCGGRLVSEVFQGSLEAGDREFTWDGRDRQGQQVAPGLYFVRLNAGQEQATNKLLMMQ